MSLVLASFGIKPLAQAHLGLKPSFNRPQAQRLGTKGQKELGLGTKLKASLSLISLVLA